MKNAIVTGAGGFIGGALTKNLLEKGVMVYGVDISEDKMSDYADHKNFIPVTADFSKYEEILKGENRYRLNTELLNENKENAIKRYEALEEMEK